jgi:hypothetical protein
MQDAVAKQHEIEEVEEVEEEVEEDDDIDDMFAVDTAPKKKVKKVKTSVSTYTFFVDLPFLQKYVLRRPLHRL